jgi:hypothetical protein
MQGIHFGPERRISVSVMAGKCNLWQGTEATGSIRPHSGGIAQLDRATAF